MKRPTDPPPTCGKCGTPVLSRALGGLCPHCLIAEGLPAKSKAPTSEPGRYKNPIFLRSFGDYDLLQEIARGGMGIIYKARQRSLGRIVAVKVLISGEFARPEFVQRFRTEAEAAARLQHPNIVAIHEVGEHEGVRYFSMDYVEGTNLAQHLNGQSLPPIQAADYLRTIAEAVHYAHQQGLLHRDLKPSNVLIDPFGEPRITDFGLAKELSGSSDLTLTGQVLGTPGYLPPEQADPTCGPLTPAADIYSLGAILYFILTTRAPFAAGSLHETLRQVLTCDPVAPRLLNPEIPRDLQTICLKCLEREPHRRYATAAALAEDLRRFIQGETIIARSPSGTGRLIRWCRRRPAVATIWLLILALAAGSTSSTVWIANARRRAETALAQVRSTEMTGRERLREARLAEARAVRHTTLPGRRAQGLAALGAAAGIRPGPDLRNEALATLMLPDVSPETRWNPGFPFPGSITLDNATKIAAYEPYNSLGSKRGPAELRHWGSSTILAQLAVPGTNRIIGPLRFSGDANLIMARYLDNSVRIWRTGENEPFLVLTNRPLPDSRTLTFGFNSDYDFSPDGQEFVLGLSGKGLSIHRVADGAERSRWDGGELFNYVRFSPDGRQVAAARISDYDTRNVFVLQVSNLTSNTVFPITRAPNHFAWSPDSQLLAVSTTERMVTLFDIQNGHVVDHLPCPGLGPGELTFIGEASWLAVRGHGTTLRIFNPALGREEIVVDSYGPSELVTLPGANSFAITSVEGIVTRWKIQPPLGFRVLPPPLPDLTAATFNNCCFDFSPDGRWVVSTHGRFSALRDTRLGRLIDEYDSGTPQGINFNTVAITDGGHALLRCSSLTGVQRQGLMFDPQGRPHFGPMTLIDAEPGFYLTDHLHDGRHLALVSPEAGEVKVLEIKGEQITHNQRWNIPDAYCAVFDPTGKKLLVNGGGNETNIAQQHLTLFQIDNRSEPVKISARPFGEIAWSADGQTVLTSNDLEQSILWDPVSWQRKTTFQGPIGGNITTFALAPDGSYAVVARDEKLHLVSTRDGSVIASFDSPSASGLAAGIRFLPDGRRFGVLWRDGRIDLFDPEELKGGLRNLGLSW